MDIEKEISLIKLLEYIKKNTFLIIMFTLITGALIFGISKFVVTPEYLASTTMIINSNQEEQMNKDDINYSQIQANKALVSTYSEIVKSKGISNEVIKNLNLDMDYEEFVKKVSIEPVNDTQIISVKVVDSIPERAKDIANETSMIFKSSVSKIMKVDNVQILDSAVKPESPASPNIFKNTIIGFCIGFIIGIFVSLFKELSDTTFKTTDDIQEAFDIPVLGMIPDKSKGE